jgi:hypothetical protein
VTFFLSDSDAFTTWLRCPIVQTLQNYHNRPPRRVVSGAHEHAGPLQACLGVASAELARHSSTQRCTQHEAGKIFGDLTLLPFRGMLVRRSTGWALVQTPSVFLKQYILDMASGKSLLAPITTYRMTDAELQVLGCGYRSTPWLLSSSLRGETVDQLLSTKCRKGVTWTKTRRPLIAPFHKFLCRPAVRRRKHGTMFLGDK